MRTEHDFLGQINLDNSKHWGVQTERALVHFAIGHERWPKEFIHAFGWQKWASACANQELRVLPGEMIDFIIAACQEVAQGLWDAHFPLSIWQSGSGTQIHMNVNEVIAQRATLLSNHKVQVHPNDHVNCGQSSNDSVPTVMHMTLVKKIEEDFLPALKAMENSLIAHAENWKDIIKVGRTHMQDAVNLSLGDEFSAFAHQVGHSYKQIQLRLPCLYALAQGGTAVGNGVNTHPEFKSLFFKYLGQALPFPFYPAPHSFAAQSAHDGLISFSGDLNALACVLVKLAQDLRWMTSGPRCGLQELVQPHNEPGSSIMPGKINPSQAEVLTMIGYQVMGLHHATTLGGIGQFQLNTAKPLIFYNLWNCLNLLTEYERVAELVREAETHHLTLQQILDKYGLTLSI